MMRCKAFCLLSATLVLAGCARSGTLVLQPYRLADGTQYQDVVTVGADPTGAAPVVTQVKTFRLAEGGSQLVAQGVGSSPGMGTVLIGSVAGGVASGATAGIIAHASSRSRGNINVINQNANTAINGDVVAP